MYFIGFFFKNTLNRFNILKLIVIYINLICFNSRNYNINDCCCSSKIYVLYHEVYIGT